LEFNVPFQHKYGYIRDEDNTTGSCSRTVQFLTVTVQEVALFSVYVTFNTA